MSLYFFDSSALIKRYVTEKGSLWVRQIVQNTSHKIFLSQITSVEIVSALARRAREGSIDSRTSHSARLYVDRHTKHDYQIVLFTQPVINRAKDLLAKYPLRAADAIQLSSALEVHQRLTNSTLPTVVFMCGDIKLTNIATQEGLQVDDPNLYL